MKHNTPWTEDIVKLRADIDKGLDDLAKGRVEPFDVEEIIKRGRELLKQRGGRK